LIFNHGQRYGQIGSKILYYSGWQYEWTVVTPRNRIKSVFIQAPPASNPSSLIQYCNDDDIIISLDAVGLRGNSESEGVRFNTYYIEFPEGATKVYLSSETGTMKLFK